MQGEPLVDVQALRHLRDTEQLRLGDFPLQAGLLKNGQQSFILAPPISTVSSATGKSHKKYRYL
jgi:hypothetical protein